MRSRALQRVTAFSDKRSGRSFNPLQVLFHCWLFTPDTSSFVIFLYKIHTVLYLGAYALLNQFIYSLSPLSHPLLKTQVEGPMYQQYKTKVPDNPFEAATVTSILQPN